MTERSIDVPDGRIFVVDEGAGPPIVLLHAGLVDLRSWDDLVPPLMAAGYRVVRYDARGFGASTTGDVEFAPWLDAVAVLDALDIDRAALVGNSLGSMTAFDMAINAPGRVVAVVGVAAALGGRPIEPTAQVEALEAELARIESAVPVDPALLVDFDVRLWLDGPGQPSDRVPARIRETVAAMDTPLHTPGRVAGRPAVASPQAADRLAELRCPVLAVAGALDLPHVIGTSRHIEAIAPNARAIVWPDVAHMIGMEQPERLAAAIVEFLAPLPRWSFPA